MRGDSAGRAFGVVNVLFGLFLALLHGLAFAGRDGADAFGRVAPAPDEDACPPVGAVVLVDYPGFALLRDFGGGDVAELAWLERAPCHVWGLPAWGVGGGSTVARVACFEGKKKAAPSRGDAATRCHPRVGWV